MSKDKVNDRLGAQDVYQPANDEPCVFTNTHRRPVSVHWLTWYIRNNPRVKLQDAQRHGEELVERLLNEPRRDVDPTAQPEKYTTNHFPKSDQKVLRLEWVIWYAYAHNVGFGSAHLAGMHDWPDLERVRRTVTFEEIKDDKNE